MIIYPKYKTFQLLIPLLKEYNIKHIVISPGSRMREFVIAVESDPYFTTYNVTDERSASYFAIGIAQELNEPVVITCTSSTATANYYPGVTEAYYQNVPLVVLTGDRHPYMLGQQEDQMINQIGMYDRVVRKSVSLPIVKDDFDNWYCQRLVNEALLELNHHKTGPIHINVPVPAVIDWENDKPIEDYPKVNRIHRLSLSNDKDYNQLLSCVQKLKSAKKILILAGQNTKPFDDSVLQSFFDKYNCVVNAEHMGNISIPSKLNLVAASEVVPQSKMQEYIPDIVISFNGTFAISRNLKESIRTSKCEHWLIDEQGDVIDAYRNLTTIFETSPSSFFQFCVDQADKHQKNNLIYYNQWMDIINDVRNIEIPFSNVYAIQKFIPNIPEKSNLHLSILNSIRLSQYCDLPKGTRVYANVGTDGIDGCLSSFFGQAAVSDKENFLIIGDLSFFYDMSSLRIKHNKPNCHILLINNHGGNEFYLQPIVPTTPQGLGASHMNSARAWAESVGFEYLSATKREEYDVQLMKFVKTNNDKPLLFEVFTDQMVDRETIYELRASYAKHHNSAVKEAIRDAVGKDAIKGIRNLFGKNK